MTGGDSGIMEAMSFGLPAKWDRTAAKRVGPRLGTAVEHPLESLEVTDAFVARDVPGPCLGLVVACSVDTGWLI